MAVPAVGSPPLPPVGDDLRQKVSAGLRWALLANFLGRVVSVGFGIAMARLLVPEDFGVYASALLVVNIVMGFNDLGLLLAVVRWQGDLRVAARTAMTLATANSLLVYGLIFLGAGPFASFMGTPDAAPVLRVLSLTLIIDGLTTVPHGLLVRAFAQDKMARAEFAAMPVGVTVGLLLAVAGAGPWAMAGAYVAGNAVSAVLVCWWSPLRVWPGFDRRAARSMLAFGGPLAATSLLEYVLLNADYLIVGRVLGPVALGFYLLAYNISNWPVAIISDAVRRVSIAAFARMEDDAERLRHGFRSTFAVIVSVSLPLVLVLAVLAEDVVVLLYGEKWRPAADVLTYLAVLGGVRVAAGYVFDLLVGVGRTRLTLVLKLLWLVVLLPGLVWAAETGGIARVGAVHAGVGLLVATPLFLVATRAVGLDLRDVLRDLAHPVVGALFAAAAGIGASAALADGWLELILVAPLMLVVFLLTGTPWRRLLRALLSMVRDRRRSDSPTG